jgi:hypothetical protein
MIALLLSLVVAFQGIPAQARQDGMVSGVLKDAEGRPIAGVRMAAITRSESREDAIASPSMAGLAETDEQGRYVLNGLPPGRYFIAAGRLDVQTYYPGTSNMALAKEVTIPPGLVVSGIDFTLGDSSVGRPYATGIPSGKGVAIPVRVIVEGGGKTPVSMNGKFVTLKLDAGTDVIERPINNTTVDVPGLSTTAYRVTVENLPDSYAVKAITYGTSDLLTNPFQLSPLTLPGPSILAQFGFPPQDPSALQAYLDGIRTVLARQSPTTVQGVLAAAEEFAQDPLNGGAGEHDPAHALERMLSAPRPGQPAPSVLNITLGRVSTGAVPGVRISGRLGVRGSRSVFVSGIAGTVYSDSTFEVYGVPPGRHTIVTRHNPIGVNPLAASVVVENSNLDGIVLEETTLLPIGALAPSPPRPAGGHPAGIVPLARFTGTLVEEASRKLIPEGKVVVTNGYASAAFPVDAEGRFEMPPLVPGAYNFEVEVFGHASLKQSLEIDDKDVKIELTARRLY